jgi:hypothetical protein
VDVPRPQVVTPRVVRDAHGAWFVCPYGGIRCCKVPTSSGDEWGTDVIAVHVLVKHLRPVQQF